MNLSYKHMTVEDMLQHVIDRGWHFQLFGSQTYFTQRGVPVYEIRLQSKQHGRHLRFEGRTLRDVVIKAYTRTHNPKSSVVSAENTLTPTY